MNWVPLLSDFSIKWAPPVVGAQHFLPPWLLTSAGDRIATTASKPRHDRKRRLFILYFCILYFPVTLNP